LNIKSEHTIITDDSLLWSRLKVGDEKSFSVLFEKYYGSLVRYGSSFSKHSEKVQDCVQDVFADVWLYKHSLRDNANVKASIIYWGGTSAEADNYLLRTDVAYTLATGDWKEKIGSQKWIALYNRPFEGWLEVRRLDYPKLTLPVNPISGYPNRLKYPSSEQQLNGTNYSNASAKIGGDISETKLFWDVF
jgi:hypothetical protein